MTKGLSNREQAIIREKLLRFAEIDKAVLFGSRVLGRNQPASDVDIALFGENIQQETIHKVHDLLNEQTSLPYFFDVVVFSSLKNEKLKRHILEEGVEI